MAGIRGGAPQRVERVSEGFFDLKINTLSLGAPSQLLRNRPDIRQAERELTAAGLDVKVARANFYPQLVLNAGVGLQAFNPTYFFEPAAVIGNIAASFVGPSCFASESRTSRPAAPQLIDGRRLLGGALRPLLDVRGRRPVRSARDPLRTQPWDGKDRQAS